jgi:hypothetical protein
MAAALEDFCERAHHVRFVFDEQGAHQVGAACGLCSLFA